MCIVSEENNEEEESVEEERKKLKELGVSSTWDILSSRDKKTKEDKEKPSFKGFK